MFWFLNLRLTIKKRFGALAFLRHPGASTIDIQSYHFVVLENSSENEQVASRVIINKPLHSTLFKRHDACIDKL